MAHRREEVYNVKLAELLQVRGATDAEAEQRHGSDMPDVLFEWFGLSAVLEAKYDEPGAGAQVAGQLEERLAAGFGSLGVGLLYPLTLKTATGDVGYALDPAVLRVQLSAIGRAPGPWHEVAGVEGLVAVLDQARAALIDDDALKVAVDLLSQAVDSMARAVAAQTGHADQIVRMVTAETMGAGAAPVSNEEREAAFRVGALSVINAAMLQMVLCDRDPKVPKIVRTTPDRQRKALLTGWRVVLAHDYRAVFEIAFGVLDTLGDSDDRLGATLVAMLDQAQQIVAKGVFGRHDLVGRVYHGLLTQQKFLATYYTSVPAATLLAALATRPEAWPSVDWASDPSEFGFRLADPACGTGTLLAASLGALRRHYASARRQAGKAVDGSELGRRLIEDNIYGFDILAYAVQVCASTLLLSSPGTIVTRSQLYQLPFGGAHGHLGSLDLLFGSAQGSLFGAWGDSITVDGVAGKNVLISTPEVDLVIMNPPFTRTQGGSRLLGSLDPDEWPTARKNLDRLAARPDVEGRVVAGLGALFIPLAHRMVREGGRMAFVLPKTMLTGTQWDRTRKLLADNYHVERIICSHEADHWNFSDSTQLAEVLLIARKLAAGEDRSSYETTWVQLTKNPNNPIDALGIATALQRLGNPGPHGGEIALGSGLFSSFGHAFTRPAPIDDSPWRHATFASSALDLAATAMFDGVSVPMPRIPHSVAIPLRKLGELAGIGPDRARLHDAFVRSSADSGYACLWGHDSKTDTGLTDKPNTWLVPSTKRPADHARRYAAELWEGSGRLMVAERIWLLTYPTAAILMSEKALANTMWPVRLNDDDEDVYKILTLWLNSTLGLIAWIAVAEETRGPWLSMKKNKLLDLPVLDVAKLGAPARAKLLKCWNAVHEAKLSAISKLGTDPVRRAIDTAIVAAIGIPEDGMNGLQSQFAAEPRLLPPAPRTKASKAQKPEPYEVLSLFG
jgi:hypothetical protein